jgi:hypothetical protein
MKTREDRIREVCAQIPTETDRERFIEMLKELAVLLDEPDGDLVVVRPI